MTADLATKSNPFIKAVREKSKLRLALMGGSGTGKTYTALSIATYLGKTAVIDTEHGSARKYGVPLFDFDVLELANYHPQNYMDAIHQAEQFGYDVLVIDSLSHAWAGTGGVLDLLNTIKKQKKNANEFAAWGDITPIQNQLIDTILAANIHIIVTLRSKMEYILEKNESGQNVPRKVGLAPIQRDNVEFEFDVIGDMDTNNTLTVTKTRCSTLNKQVFQNPGADIAEILRVWLDDGEMPVRILRAMETYLAENNPAGRERFKELLETLNITSESHAYYLVNIEPGKTLSRFGETVLSEVDLHQRIKDIHAALQAEHTQMQPAQPKAQNGQPAMSATDQARFMFKDGTSEDFDRLLTTAQQGGMVDQKATVDEITRAISMQLKMEQNASKPKPASNAVEGTDVDAVITSVFVVHDGKDEKLHSKPRLKLKVKDAMGHEHTIGEFSGEAYYSRGYFPREDLHKVGETYEAHIPCKIYQSNGYWNVRYDSLATIPVEIEPIPEGAENVDF